MSDCTGWSHDWSKWEQYTETGTILYSGFLVPKEMRGKTAPYSEKRQKRTCKTCGYMEDRLVSE